MVVEELGTRSEAHESNGSSRGQGDSGPQTLNPLPPSSQAVQAASTCRGRVALLHRSNDPKHNLEPKLEVVFFVAPPPPLCDIPSGCCHTAGEYHTPLLIPASPCVRMARASAVITHDPRSRHHCFEPQTARRATAPSGPGTRKPSMAPQFGKTATQTATKHRILQRTAQALGRAQATQRGCVGKTPRYPAHERSAQCITAPERRRGPGVWGQGQRMGGEGGQTW